MEMAGVWNESSSEVCYTQTTGEAFCGLKDVCHQKGLILPLVLELTWSRETRAVLYFFSLIYSFLGVSIAADIFMSSIEKITSTTKKIHIASSSDDGDDVIEVPVWNGTVANLTLMALGSSAPEILLSIIEIVGNNFEAGELGPGTIVGSAAFNLLGISAVCIVGIPNKETRRIDQIVVFAVTATFSIFAYIWLLVILKLSSPNVVEVWESVLTFVFFPVLVLIAYSADKGWLNRLLCLRRKEHGANKKRQIELGEMNGEAGDAGPGRDEEMLQVGYHRQGSLDRDGLVSFIKELKRNTKLSDEDAAILAASKIVDSRPHSRMWYRIGAVRSFTGGRKTLPSDRLTHKLKEGFKGFLAPRTEDGAEVYDAINENPEAPNITFPDDDETADTAIIEFHASSAAVLESVGVYNVLILRHGRMSETVRVRVETIDGSANEGEDYEPINSVLTFEPGEREKQVGVTIVDDNQWEPDEEFFIKLTLLPGDDSLNVKLGRTSIMEITILNDDLPGTLQFEKRGHLVKESCGLARIAVSRNNGADGTVSVKWRTVDKSAINGKDYRGGEGVLTFNHGECERTIDIAIINDMEFEKDENFEIELFEPSGGADIGKMNRTAVTITNDDEFHSVINRLMVMTNTNVDSMRLHNETWAQQLKDAMNVNGGDVDNATALDYVMHLLTFVFKIVFALIPPPGMLGGWLCFFASLAMIGILTAIVGDLAGIFGCLVGLKDSVTAITFVALGTSLPDTFASRTAAINEKYADNAIGNVTGSNSVNVFLGLGLPWMIAAIYHAIKGDAFVVQAGSLGFSVSLYTVCAALAVALFTLRRFLPFFGGAELGGPLVPKCISAVFLGILWASYILFSTLQAYNIIKAPF